MFSCSDASDGDGSGQRWLSELRARGARVVQVTYPRTANNDKELTVVRGEFLEVRSSSWLKVNSTSSSRGSSFRQGAHRCRGQFLR